MSNLLKGSYAVTKGERVIDYNELIKAKLNMILESEEKEKVNPDGFVKGLNAQVVEELISDDENNEMSENDGAALEQLQAQAQTILDDANSQAQIILEEARQQALEEAVASKEQGYSDGIKEADAEISKRKAQLENEYSIRKQQLESEYSDMKNRMESDLVEVITEIFGKVIYEIADDDKEIIMKLINGVMENSDMSHEFVIKVSPDDYQYVIDNQGKIYCAMTKDVNIDIFEDKSLNKNECIIETDGGVFNCSLEVEMKNLIKKIKVLSCI